MNPEIDSAWRRWLESRDNTQSHVDYSIGDEGLRAHIDACAAGARAVIDSVIRSVEKADFSPERVLDIGCSTGFKALAAQERFSDADVVGIDPDKEALLVARLMAEAECARKKRPSYVRGVGEALPYNNDTFDLVLSTTVIEHVGDVDRCLSEAARVLRPGGYLYIEAPNYLWPFEPHLGVFMPPRCPKPLLRALARLQGKGDRAAFIDHLQLVYPKWIERRLHAVGLAWKNEFRTKLERVLSGDSAEVHSYHFLARILRILGFLGFRKGVRRVVLASGLYPSLIYVAEKRRYI